MSGAVPKLRFPGFSGEWKPARAGDAFAKGTARGEPGLPIYSVTMDRGLVPRDSLDRHMGDDAADGVNLRAEAGDVVYNMMRMWQGAVGVADRACMVSPAYVVLKPRKQTSAAFFNHWFENKRMLYKLGAYSHGLTSDRLRLYYDDFAKIPLHLPTLPEQEKIAGFLGAVDGKISGLRQKEEGLKRFKAGLMQKLFSQELRFTRDDGSDFPEWQERSLGEIGTFRKGKGIAKDDIVPDGATPCIRYGELYTVYSEVISAIVSRTNVPPVDLILSKGGEIIIPASGETPEDMARASYVAEAGIAIGGDINIFSSPFGGPFLAHFLTHRRRNQIAKIAQGNSVVHLYAAQLASLSVPLPHRDEQLKIAEALSALDGKIAGVRDQIAGLETFKKGLLQQMFV